MLFTTLWTLLSPLLIAAIKTLLPWLIERITADVKAGRKTIITDDDIKYQMNGRKEQIRAAYKGN